MPAAANISYSCFKQENNYQNRKSKKHLTVSLKQWTDIKICFMLLIFLASDNYVHRLVASKTDGKMVQYECEGDTCHAEKIDALQLEVSLKRFSWLLLFLPDQHRNVLICCLQYSYLLTSQLESQRIYWENKIVHLEKETAEEV